MRARLVFMTLAGLFVPLITPFTESGALDVVSLERLANGVLDDGATGIVALGTTAEAATLTAEERDRVLDVCAGVCAERGAPLIVGAGSNSTAASSLALDALDPRRVTAALTVVPYFTRPSEAGVLAHFRAVAATSPVPLVVYNIPYRTGQVLGIDTLRELAALPAVIGFKHAVGGVDETTVALLADPDTTVLAGDDLFAAALLALGAPGAILASAHLATAHFAAMIDAWRDGPIDRARDLGHRLATLAATLFAEPNPVVVKAVLARQGRIASPAVRLPLLPASDAVTDRAVTASLALSYATG